MKISLCFITDEYYAMPTCVTISSILKNKNENTIYDIYILCRNVSETKKKKFMELNTDKTIINNIDMNGLEDFSDYEIEGIPANQTAIYKFFIPDILNGLNRVLYLDGDIIVKKDLEELYNLDIGNNNYIAAVKDTNGLDYKSLRESNYRYFNSGVMLMNLQKMREDNLSEKLLNYRKNGYNRLMDQDTFNFILKDSTLLLDFKYNTQINALASEIQRYKNYNLMNIKKYWNISDEVENVNNLIEKSVILHYTKAKPWKFYDGYGNDIWFEHYIKSPYGEESLHRDSYYLKRIINSSTYKIGKIFTYPFKKFKKNFLNQKNKEYKKFLQNFS